MDPANPGDDALADGAFAESSGVSRQSHPSQEEILLHLRDELLQSVLAVALVLDSELQREPKQDVPRSRVQWAVNVLHDAARDARQALHLSDLSGGS